MKNYSVDDVSLLLEKYKEVCKASSLQADDLKTSELIINYTEDFMKYVKLRDYENALKSNRCFTKIVYDTLSHMPEVAWDLKKSVGNIAYKIERENLI